MIRIPLLLLGGLLLGLQAAEPWQTLADAQASDPLTAKRLLDTLLIEHPSFLPGHFNLGTLLMGKEPENAARHLEIATASTTGDLAHDAWYNLALVRWHQGRLEDAVAAANKALTLATAAPTAPATLATRQLRDELQRAFLIRQDQARRKAEEEAKKLRLAATTLPPAHVGEAYDQHLTAAGGAGGYRFALGSTKDKDGKAVTATLPAGLALDADGRLHGVPTQAGSHQIPLVLNDQAKADATGTVTLEILPAPAITTATLPEAIVDAPYEATLTAVGLDRPAWTVSGLPPGLKVDDVRGPSVRITGTPTTTGTQQIQLRADDGVRHAERGPLALVISDSFAPDPAVLPPATAWAPYTHKLGVRGKPQTYRWRSAGGGGLALNADGLVTGTPEQAGELKIAVTISAADGRQRDTAISVPVNPPPVIDESTPIELHEGEAVNRPLKVTGGTPPYAWQLVDGVLPHGLRLDRDGALRGAAGEPGETEITVALSDRWQATTRQKIKLTVKPADPKQDQAKNDDKKKQEEQKKDEQKQDGQDQQKGDDKQAGKDGQDGKQPQPQPQPGKDGDQPKPDPAKPDPSGADQQQAKKPETGGAGQDKEDAAKDAAAQAQQLNHAAADRWLDKLPKEDRGVLMYQLLEGGGARPRKDGKTW